ncbi:MAG: hypothetical protein RIE58_03485 [Vicingaceae bacterium]
MKRFSSYLTYPVLIGLVSFFLFLAKYEFIIALGLGYTVFIFFLFMVRLGKTIPILELILLMASLQWILGAHFSYSAGFEHFKYIMYVSELEYMMLVVPSILSFSVGIFIFYPKLNLEGINDSLTSLVTQQPSLPYIFVALGFAGDFIAPSLSGIIGFAAYLTKSLKYVGLGLMIFQQTRNKWLYFTLIMGLTLVNSIVSGSFHDLLLWSALMFSLVAVKNEFNFVSKFLLVLSGMFFAFILQTSKQEYRENIVGKSREERVQIFSEVVQSRVTDLSTLFQSGYLEMTNVRLNQGWIISAVLNHVPKYEPYANGETVYDAALAAIFPRFLMPDKKKAGGRENYRRFTGLNISDQTSMGISIVGEAYANYGLQGAYVFMFVWGSFLSWTVKFFSSYSSTKKVVFVFLPLIYLQVIKAETELVVVLNHLVKSSIFVLIILWMITADRE